MRQSNFGGCMPCYPMFVGGIGLWLSVCYTPPPPKESVLSQSSAIRETRDVLSVNGNNRASIAVSLTPFKGFRYFYSQLDVVFAGACFFGSEVQ